MLRSALNAPRRLARRLRFFADEADPTELPQKPPPVCVPRASVPLLLTAIAVKSAVRSRDIVAARCSGATAPRSSVPSNSHSSLSL